MYGTLPPLKIKEQMPHQHCVLLDYYTLHSSDDLSTLHYPKMFANSFHIVHGVCGCGELKTDMFTIIYKEFTIIRKILILLISNIVTVNLIKIRNAYFD